MHSKTYLPRELDFSKDERRSLDYDDGRIYVFTDGACKLTKQGTFGGWATILYWRGHEKEQSGSAFGCALGVTNNIMELTAILEGMRAITAKSHDKQAVIISDSQYCLQCIAVWAQSWERNGWLTTTGTPVQNKKLIQDIRAIKQPWMSFKWVKGHAGHKYNERVDQLAVAARTELEKRTIALTEMSNRVKEQGVRRQRSIDV